MIETFLYGYSLPTPRRTLAEMEQFGTWRLLDPEFKRRLVAIMRASNYTLGFGGGWRSSAQQEALFRSRYHVVAGPTGIFWNGQYWAINAGVAPSTPPDRSYHEGVTPTDPRLALAADMIGNLAYLDVHGKDYGLRDLSDVNDEPWHGQPSELPTARRNWTTAMHPLKRWVFPGDQPDPIIPPPPLEETDMPIVVKPYDGPDVNNIDVRLLDPAAFSLNGIQATCIDNYPDMLVAQMVGTIPAGEPKVIARSILKSYTLVGAEPDYSNTPYDRPTVAGDFRHHVPAAF